MELHGLCQQGQLLEAVRRGSAGFFALADDPASWTAPTGAGDWEVRDAFGHLIDTTETYFVGFDAARGDGEPRRRCRCGRWPSTWTEAHGSSGACTGRKPSSG